MKCIVCVELESNEFRNFMSDIGFEYNPWYDKKYLCSGYFLKDYDEDKIKLYGLNKENNIYMLNSIKKPIVVDDIKIFYSNDHAMYFAFINELDDIQWRLFDIDHEINILSERFPDKKKMVLYYDEHLCEFA